MRIEKYICDHCGKIIDVARDYDSECIELGSYYTDLDLCDDCADELIDIIDNFISNVVDGNKR